MESAVPQQQWLKSLEREIERKDIKKQVNSQKDDIAIEYFSVYHDEMGQRTNRVGVAFGYAVASNDSQKWIGQGDNRLSWMFVRKAS